jgi:LPS export ABC transporter protein LptC
MLNISYKTSSILLALAILSGLMAWFLDHWHHDPFQGIKINAESYGINITVNRYDELGKPEYSIISPYLIHSDKNKQTIFQRPIMILFNKTAEPWHISANQAISTEDFSFVTLKGTVHLEQKLGLKNNGLMISTNVLYLDSKRQIAYTYEPIELIEQGTDGSKMIIRAKGALANQKTGQISFLSKTKVLFTPANSYNGAQ